ncbi:uncharacterized protein mideasb isoform 1-T4 [Synchiropus picturatus]
MPIMSIPAQQTPTSKRTGKSITFFTNPSLAMKETPPQPEGSYYVPGVVSDPGQSEAASTVTSNPEGPHMYLNSVIFSPEKGEQNRGHYQQTVQMKWNHPEQQQQQPLTQQQRASSWTAANWAQNFAGYVGSGNLTDARIQTAFAKSMHEGSALQHPQSKPLEQPLGSNPSVEPFRDAAKDHGQDWEQQQTFTETLKPGALNAQQHSGSHPGGSSVLQPFQLAFGQPKQHLPAYYQTFPGNRTTLPNPPNYPPQPQAPAQKSEQIQRHQQQIIQQQIHQQQQQQQQQQHQMQQQQIIQHQQQLQLQHEQQKQKMQIQQQQQLQMQHQQLQQQNPHVLDYFPGAQSAHPQPVVVHSQESSVPAPPTIQEPLIQDITPEPQQPLDPLHPLLASDLLSQTQLQSHQLRRSRRLSKEGGAPSDGPVLNSSDQAAPGPQGSQNGGRDIQAAPTGVIQSTRRKRRVSQEVNLETLAQKASEMESLPSHVVKEPHSPPEREPHVKRPRDDGLLPLVIPVSVPVRRQEPSSPDLEEVTLTSNWPLRLPHPHDLGHHDHKPSVIVTRRRSLRNSLSESSEQNGGPDDDDGKKSKRRPRPEPLFIPPPKPGLFISPPVYTSITPYQSHLRSPVRLADNPLAMPPYTPPPILSPVREGSGLYFSTFLSAAGAAAAGAAGLPPPATPKSATRSLLCSSSCDMTPPVLSAIGEATPVSIEPAAEETLEKGRRRINIGSRYQAEVPELRQQSAVEQDHHQADLLWTPTHEEKVDYQRRVEDLMRMACSSVLPGGGTNQELAHHCLHECRGDIMAALALMMMKTPLFPEHHPLSSYHYAGSDEWTAAERRQFNKGIATYKKDFFMVQKQVTTKTVAQCVEFYYTYKKHVKIGRSGVLTYGEAEPLESRTAEEDVSNKSSHSLETHREVESRKWDGPADRKQEFGPGLVTLQPTENPGTVLIMKGQDDPGRDPPLARVISLPPPAPLPVSKPRYDSAARKPASASTATKPATNQEGEFPCKKCGRIFYKVKSRSAHMKSHAEQEKKAAALRQKEAEERAAVAAKAAAMLAARQQNGTRQMGGDSTNDDSTEGEDEDDDDWK